MWLAWRHGACLVPAARSLVRSGVDLGPWLAEQRITVVSTVPTLAALWPVEALEDVRLLIFGGEACPPELAERAGRRGPRGLEHLRADRGDRRRLRRAADRRGPGAHRAAAGRLGARGGRRRRRAGRDGRDRRAGDRRRRARPLPRHRARTPRSSPRCRRWAGSGRTAAATSCAPTRPRAAVPRARRRAGQARRAPDRAGRGRRRAAGAARRRRRGRGGAAHRRGQPAAGGVRGAARRRWTSTPRRSRGSASSCRPRSCRCWPWWTRCRPAPPARWTGPRCPGRCPRAADAAGELTATEDWLAGGWAEILGVSAHRGGRRLLHPRRRQPERGATGGVDPAAGTRRSRWPTSTSTRSWRGSRPCWTRSTRGGDPPRGPADAAAGRAGQALLMVPMLALVGLRWLTVLAALGNVLALVAAPWAPAVSWWWAGAGLAAAVQPAGPDRHGRRAERGCCCAACAPAATRAAARAPAAVGRRAPRRADRRHRRRRAPPG